MLDLASIDIIYYLSSEQQTRWSDCADAQVGLHLCWPHSAKTGFLMTWPIWLEYRYWSLWNSLHLKREIIWLGIVLQNHRSLFWTHHTNGNIMHYWPIKLHVNGQIDNIAIISTRLPKEKPEKWTNQCKLKMINYPAPAPSTADIWLTIMKIRKTRTSRHRTYTRHHGPLHDAA